MTSSSLKKIYISIFALATTHIWAKTCTETDIRNGVSKGNFSYVGSDCTNTGGLIKVKNSINIGKSGTKVDGGGKMKIQWSGGGSCSDNEGGPALFNVDANNVLLKGFEVSGVPDGIHITTGIDNVLDSIVFSKICEDAVTNGNMRSNSAKKTIIRNSTFMNAQDKAVQVNGGSIKIVNSKFIKVFRPVSACGTKANPGYHGPGKCPQPSRIVFMNNKVDTCDYGGQSNGIGNAKSSFVVMVDNNFKNCKTIVRAQESGRLYAEGNVSEGTCDLGVDSKESSSIETCENNLKCTTARRGTVKESCRTPDYLETTLGWKGALN